MADHLPVAAVLGQMAHPAAHQIKHHRIRAKPLGVKGRQAAAEGTIEVLHKAGLGIEQRVVRAILFAALRLAEYGHR